MTQHLATFLPLTDQVFLSMTCKQFSTLKCRTDTVFRPLPHQHEEKFTVADYASYSALLGGLCYYMYLIDKYNIKSIVSNIPPYAHLITATLLGVAGLSRVYLTEKISSSQWYRNYRSAKEQASENAAAAKKAQELAHLTTAYEAIARRIKEGTLTITNELHLDYYAPQQAAPLLSIVKSHRISKLTLTTRNTDIDSYSIDLYSIIAYNTTLRSLALEGYSHRINIDRLCRGLRHNDHLTELSLSDFHSAELHPIIQTIATKTAVKKLSLEMSELLNTSICISIPQTPLEHIQLRGCFSDFNISDLLLLMRNSRTLKSIDIADNDFTRSGMDRIIVEAPAHIKVKLKK